MIETEYELSAESIGPLTPKGAQVHLACGRFVGHLVRLEAAHDGHPAIVTLSHRYPREDDRLEAAEMYWITTRPTRPETAL